MIFKWYAADFVTVGQALAPARSGTQAVATAVVSWLRGARQKELVDLLERGGAAVRVEHSVYDWGTNAGSAKVYKRSEMRDTSYRFMGCLH